MASVVSIPTVIHTALRSVEYKFSMPSVGVAPEKKYFRYRLKNVTNNVYLTDWKFYEPVADGQVIVIDFARDLEEIVYTSAPPFYNPNVVSYNINIIKAIAVEYGERTINTETCEDPVDTLDGTTDHVDVINGIHRPYGQAIKPVLGRKVLTDRPERYSLHPNTYDWVYVFGEVDVTVAYYDDDMNLISVNDYFISESHPGSRVAIIPCGFQNAPAGTAVIGIYTSDQIQINNPNGLVFTIDGNLCACDNGEVRDLYLQNNYGGVDPLSFECVSGKDMAVAKQYLTRKYDEGVGETFRLADGQRRVTKNSSAPIVTLTRQFDLLSYKDSRWLDEMASSGNLWVRETFPDGVDRLVRVNIVDATIPTYSTEDVEFILQIQYSEEWIYPN